MGNGTFLYHFGIVHCTRTRFLIGRMEIVRAILLFFHQMYARSQECFAKRFNLSSFVLFWRFHNLLVIFCRSKTAFRSQNV